MVNQASFWPVLLVILTSLIIFSKGEAYDPHAGTNT